MPEDAKPMKIDAASVKRLAFPPLTHERVDRMARSAYEAMAELCNWHQAGIAWEKNEKLRDDWRASAKAAYAVLALDAGAKPEGLKGGLE